MARLKRRLRGLLAAPWYFAAGVAVIALTIALVTTVFAVAQGVLWRALPYDRADELFDVSAGYSEPVRARAGMAAGNRAGLLLSLRDRDDFARAFQKAAISAYTSPVATSGGSLSDWSPLVASVGPEFFAVLGVGPQRGGFAAADYVMLEGVTISALISDGAWRLRFGSRSDIVGQPFSVDRQNYRVAGVLPANFVFPSNGAQPDLLVPLTGSPEVRSNRRARQYRVIARLPASVPIAAYRERFSAVMRAAAREIGPTDENGGAGPTDAAALRPLDALLGAAERQRLWTVLAITGGLMLLGCVNVSGLLTTRMLDRRRELSVLAALGARRRDIALDAVLESGVIVVTGALLGVAASAAILPLVRPVLVQGLGIDAPASLDWRVFVCALLACVTCMMTVSAWPLLRGVTQLTAASLAPGGLTMTRGHRRERVAVIAAQIALGLVVTAAGTLVVGSLLEASGDMGFEPEGLVLVQARFESASPPPDATREQILAFEETARRARSGRLAQLLDRLRAIPGVVSAGATSAPVLTGTFPGGLFAGNSYPVSAGFIEAVRPRLLAGRWPTDSELDAGAPVVVVTPAAAAREFPGRNPIGELLSSSIGGMTVIGVAAPARYAAWDETQAQVQPQYYVPYRLMSFGPRLTLAIRGNRRTGEVRAAIQQDTALGGQGIRLTSAAAAEDVLAGTILRRRMQSWVFGAFAAASLLIVATGVLGLVSVTTARRGREMGIRISAGSSPSGVVRLILREQVAAIVIGVTTGIVVSVGVMLPSIRAYVFTANPLHPQLWASAVMALVIATLMGALPPALRVGRIDPVTALRAE